MFGGGCQQKKGRCFSFCNGRATLEIYKIFFNIFILFIYFFHQDSRPVKKIERFSLSRRHREYVVQKIILSVPRQTRGGKPRMAGHAADLLRHGRGLGVIAKTAAESGRADTGGYKFLPQRPKRRRGSEAARFRPHCAVAPACALVALRPARERRPASSRAPGVSRHWAKSLRQAPNSRKP